MLSAGISRFGVQQAAGADAAVVESALQTLSSTGFTPAQMAVLVQAIVDARGSQPDATSLFDLVLSGPDLPSVPTADTGAVVHTLITQAQREVLLVGYAIHNGRELFKPLAEQMELKPSLRIMFCLDINRPYGDTSHNDEIVRRFAGEFRTKHWPWERVPKVFFDPRALVPVGPQRGSLHAKCVVIDRSIALVTSANFTEAAQHRNIEAGLLIRHPGTVDRIVMYFEGLIACGHLKTCELA
jgi:phosphatidylserine/phosphatidylglycerophosphate/cardiolipin synthase-like enzyme